MRGWTAAQEAAFDRLIARLYPGCEDGSGKPERADPIALDGAMALAMRIRQAQTPAEADALGAFFAELNRGS